MTTQRTTHHDTGEYTHLQIRLPADLKHRFKVRCTEEDVDMTDVLTDAIESYLATGKGRKTRR